MPRNVRCALIQASNALNTTRPLQQIRKAMIDKHLKMIEQAARKKAQILCLQELFYGPYFCAEQNARWYELTERVPDGPAAPVVGGRALDLVRRGAGTPDEAGGKVDHTDQATRPAFQSLPAPGGRSGRHGDHA